MEKYINIMKNTIRDTQYMTKQKKDKFLKYNEYSNKTIDELFENNSNELIKKLEEYEYEKNYKFFTLHKFDAEKLNVENLRKSKKINNDDFDKIGETIDKPTMKEHDSNNIDLKFSILINQNYKYVVIASIFLDLGIIAIKFCSIEGEYYHENMYINIKNRVKNYIENELNIKLEDINTKSAFEKLYKKIKDNTIDDEVSLYSAKFEDDLNGTSYFKATVQEILPFIQSLDQLINDFESEKDKQLIKSYIEEYEENSKMSTLAIKWKKKFSDNTQGKKGNVVIGIREIYVEDKVTNQVKLDCIRHNVLQKSSVNKERIDYGIRYIAKYIE